mgnify:CR=1 FL=1
MKKNVDKKYTSDKNKLWYPPIENIFQSSKKKIATKKNKNIRISKNQIVVPSENVVFGISKELDLSIDPQIFLEWFESV